LENLPIAADTMTMCRLKLRFARIITLRKNPNDMDASKSGTSDAASRKQDKKNAVAVGRCSQGIRD
jgi:hypothetical protein